MEYITHFTPYRGLLGGILIGLSSVLFLLFNGRIAGISGFIHGLLPLNKSQQLWRAAFLSGLILSGLLYYVIPSIQFPLRTDYPVYLLLAGGFCVGFGTRMGQGCTSGHGVCGMARISRRSIAATITFFVAAVITTFILRHLLGIH